MGIDEIPEIIEGDNRDFGDTGLEPAVEQAVPALPEANGNGKNGLDKILKQYGLESVDELQEILSGTKRLDKKLGKYNLTESELDAILQSGRGKKPISVPHLDISDKHFRYGYFGDAHIGHSRFHEELWDKMVRLFKQESVDFIVDAGDHLEGMSNRPGHVYELATVEENGYSGIGYKNQMAKAVELFNQLPVKTYGIDGNHDAWYFKPQNMGVVVGEGLEEKVENYTHIGQMEGDIEAAPGIIIKLYHPNDGTAYADSYKLQKFIESLTGGEKPSIVHSGHYHKSIYLFRRNIHGFESATLCGQTEFMRGKKIPAHIGFGIVDVYVDKNGGIDRLRHEFVPYYEVDKGE